MVNGARPAERHSDGNGEGFVLLDNLADDIRY